MGNLNRVLFSHLLNQFLLLDMCSQYHFGDICFLEVCVNQFPHLCQYDALPIHLSMLHHTPCLSHLKSPALQVQPRLPLNSSSVNHPVSKQRNIHPHYNSHISDVRLDICFHISYNQHIILR